MKALRVITLSLIFHIVLVVNCVAGGVESGGSESHGGDGVIIGSNTYVLDLVEAGVERDPFFDPAVIPEDDIRDILKTALMDLKTAPIDLISRKLTEIKLFDPTLARAIIMAIQRYEWAIVNSALVDVKDEDSVLEFHGLRLVQLAIRRDIQILIARDNWATMEDSHKAALVLHEAIYSLEKKQCSRRARIINGFFFKKSFASVDLAKAKAVIASSLPSSKIDDEKMATKKDPLLLISRNNETYFSFQDYDRIIQDDLTPEAERSSFLQACKSLGPIKEPRVIHLSFLKFDYEYILLTPGWVLADARNRATTDRVLKTYDLVVSSADECASKASRSFQQYKDFITSL